MAKIGNLGPIEVHNSPVEETQQIECLGPISTSVTNTGYMHIRQALWGALGRFPSPLEKALHKWVWENQTEVLREVVKNESEMTAMLVKSAFIEAEAGRQAGNVNQYYLVFYNNQIP